MNKKFVDRIERLNGKKILIAGNHDTLNARGLLEYFSDVKGSIALGEFILTHIPVHPSQLEYRWKANIHGHLHSNRVQRTSYSWQSHDPRYYNVSMECLEDYTPISYENAKKDINYALEVQAN